MSYSAAFFLRSYFNIFYITFCIAYNFFINKDNISLTLYSLISGVSVEKKNSLKYVYFYES